MGRLYERDGNYDKAFHYFREAVRYAITIKLQFGFYLTKYSNSKYLTRIFVSIEPDDVRGHLNLGNLLVKINKSDEAEKSYRRATNLLEESAKSSDQISAMHLTALLRLAELISKDPQKAKEAFQLHERILTLKSDFRPAFENWSKVMRASNRHQEAAVMLAKALEYESSDPDVLYNVSRDNRKFFNLIHFLSL